MKMWAWAQPAAAQVLPVLFISASIKAHVGHRSGRLTAALRCLQFGGERWAALEQRGACCAEGQGGRQASFSQQGAALGDQGEQGTRPRSCCRLLPPPLVAREVGCAACISLPLASSHQARAWVQAAAPWHSRQPHNRQARLSGPGPASLSAPASAGIQRTAAGQRPTSAQGGAASVH